MNNSIKCSISLISSLAVILLLSPALPCTYCDSSRDDNYSHSVPEASLDDREKNWNVAIGKMTGQSSFQIICGGVRNRWNQIITSASCLDNNQLICGCALKCVGPEEDSPQPNIGVVVLNAQYGMEKIVSVDIHPDYSTESYKGDLAVLALRSRFYMTNVKVPAESRDFSTASIFLHPELNYLSFWNVSNINNAYNKSVKMDPSAFQRTVQVTLVDAATCETKYRSYFQNQQGTTIETHDPHESSNSTLPTFDTVFPGGIDSTVLCVTADLGQDCGKYRGYQLVAMRETVHRNGTVHPSFILGPRTENRIKTTDSPCQTNSLPMIFTNVLLYQDWMNALRA